MSISILDDETIFSEEKFNKDELELSFTVPAAIVFSENLSELSDKESDTRKDFDSELLKLRSALYYDLGVLIPYIYVGEGPLPENEYYISIFEVPVGRGKLFTDKKFVDDSAENIKVFGIKGENVKNQGQTIPGAWILAKDEEAAKKAGLKIYDYRELVLLHLSKIIKRYASNFIGIQETQDYLDFIAKGMPQLVEETLKVASIHLIKDILERLVGEGISIRDLRTILNAISEWGRIEKDPVLLTEHIRAAMRRYISFRYANGSDTLFVYLLDPEIEDVIRGAIRRTQTGSFLSLDPTVAEEILDAIRKEIADQPPTAQQPVIVTDMELRRFVRKMVEIEFPNLAVLSYQELTPELNIQPIDRLTLPKKSKKSPKETAKTTSKKSASTVRKKSAE